MNIKDIIYVCHSDIDNSFNMISHLTVTQFLSMVKVKEVMPEVKSFAPCTWTFLWVNFNKTYGSHYTILATLTNTQSKPLTVQHLFYLRLKIAQIKPAKASVKIHVTVKKRECKMKLSSIKCI